MRIDNERHPSGAGLLITFGPWIFNKSARRLSSMKLICPALANLKFSRNLNSILCGTRTTFFKKCNLVRSKTLVASMPFHFFFRTFANVLLCKMLVLLTNKRIIFFICKALISLPILRCDFSVEQVSANFWLIVSTFFPKPPTNAFIAFHFFHFLATEQKSKIKEKDKKKHHRGKQQLGGP